MADDSLYEEKTTTRDPFFVGNVIEAINKAKESKLVLLVTVQGTV